MAFGNQPFPQPEPERIQCRLVRIKDADTYVLKVNWQRESNFELAPPYDIRLKDYDAYERNTPEGKLATQEVAQLFGTPGAVPVEIIPFGHDKYGRLLAWVWVGLGKIAIGPYLEKAGLIKPKS